MESQLTTHNRRVETEVLARQGLRLPPITLKCLRTAGIYCQPSVSIEHQHLAKKYVLRGVESGGAVAEVGAYASFVGEQGDALPLASARGQHRRKRCARGCRRTGTDPDTNAPDRADLRSVNYSARTGEVEARPETTARKLDPLLWPQGRPGDGAVGQGRRVPRYCLSGFLHAIGGTCCLAKPPPGCGHANDSCRVLRRLPSLSLARTQSDYHGANGEAQRSRCKRRAKRERRCSCERSGVRSLEWATA